MIALLVQHGQAKSKAEDPERSLTDAGSEAVERMALWLGASGVEVDEIRHSGKRRAEQTASIFARHLTPAPRLVPAAGLDPMDDVRPLADELRRHRGSLMIVGHLPFLSRLTGLLVAGDPEREVVRYQNAGVVCLRESRDCWGVAWAVVPGLA